MSAVPAWLQPLVDALPHVSGEQLSAFLPPEEGGRRSAVLVLFGEGPMGPDLLFIERASTLRSHAGQPAFPGGALDDSDAGPVEAALREAQEEVGLDPASVQVVGTLPDLWLPPSGFVVTPVLAWWRDPHHVSAVDEAEVAAVARVPIAELVDPANRVRLTHPSGYVAPAFEVRDLLVWGFTAGLTDRLLELGGWAVPWDRTRMRELDPDALALARRTSPRPTGADPETRMRPHLLLLAPLAVALAGCGGSSGPSGGGGVGTATGPPDAQVFTIHGTDKLQFDPQTVRAKVGTLTLTLRNAGVPHDLKFADPALPALPTVSGDRTATATLRFAKPGTYTFVCTIHPGMAGKVVVSA